LPNATAATLRANANF